MKFFSYIFFVITFVLIGILNPLEASAFSAYSAKTQKLDIALSDQTNTMYTNPTKIYVAQVTTESPSLSRNPSQWVNALYYYSITRLHFADIPYTYLLDENGIIYEGRSGGIGANPELRDIDGAVLIGYLSNNPSLTTRATISLSQMVEEISYEWGISTLQAVKLSLVQSEGKLATLVAKETSGEFALSVKESVSTWKGYQEEHHTYKVEIEEVTFPEDAVIGSRITVKVKIKNVNDFVWFTDKDPIYVSVKDGKESDFSINQLWDSFSKPVSIVDKSISPGESIEVSFDMEARVLMGEVREKFDILKYENQPFEDSEFEVKFRISRGDYKLVEVASAEYGFVNIRDCKWFSCKILDSADNGEIFILLEEGDGWSKVRYGASTQGWVMSRYLKKI